jgi:hypothetical protein
MNNVLEKINNWLYGKTKLFTFLVGGVFVLLMLFIFTSEYLRTDGNDGYGYMYLIMPGYAFNQGLNNEMFLTGQGLLFSMISGLAIKFLDVLNLGLNKADLTMALFLQMGLLIIWALIKFLTKTKILFLVLLTIVFIVPWGLPLNIPAMVERHNPFMWGYIWLQIIFILSIIKDKQKLELSSKRVIALSFICALFCFITFNYKMNFFIGAALLSAIFLVYIDKKFAIKYVLYCSGFFIVLNALASVIFDYNYLMYVEYNSGVAAGKVWNIARNIRVTAIAIAFFIIFWGMIMVNKVINYRPSSLTTKGFITFYLNYLKIFLPQNKRDYQNLFTIFILSSGIYVIGMFNADTAGRNYIILFIIVFFNFIKTKIKVILFFLFCLIWFGFYGFLDFRLFAVSDKNYGFTKMDFVNVNPKHDLKFISYFETPSSMENDLNMIDIFKSLKQTGEKFSLDYDDTVVLCGPCNYAPFVLNSKLPIPSLHDYYIGQTLTNLVALPGGIDVFVAPEYAGLNEVQPLKIVNNYLIIDSLFVVRQFKALLEKDDRYVIFYRDGYINYWGRKEWLEKKGIEQF